MWKVCTLSPRNSKVKFDKNKCRHDAHCDGLLKSAKFKVSANVFSYRGEMIGHHWLHAREEKRCVIPRERSAVMKSVHFWW